MICNKCNPETIYKNSALLGIGNPNAELIFIFDNPTSDDATYNKPFANNYNYNKLIQLLPKANINPLDCYYTYLVKCTPFSRVQCKYTEPTQDHLFNCIEHLDAELSMRSNKKVIIWIGSAVYKAFTGKAGLNAARGTKFWSNKYNCWVVPILSLGILSREPSKEIIIQSDLQTVLRACRITQQDANVSPNLNDYVLIDTLPKLNDFMAKFKEFEASGKVISLDTETTSLNFKKAKIICFSISFEEGSGFVIPMLRQREIPPKPIRAKKVKGDEDIEKEEDEEDLGTVVTEQDSFWGKDEAYVKACMNEITSSNVKKVFQNNAYDVKIIRENGYILNGVYADTMFMHYLLDENLENMHHLKTMASIYTDMGKYDIPLDEFFNKYPWIKNQYIYIPTEMLVRYAGMDSDCTLRLYNKFKVELEKQDLWTFFQNFIMPLSEMLVEMEYDGIQVSRERLNKLKLELEQEIEVLSRDIKIKVGDVNVHSPKQLQKLLFVDLKLPIIKYTFNKKRKTAAPPQPSTDDEVMEALIGKHSVITDIMKYRKATKLYKTYVIGVENKLDDKARIHTSFLITATVTGRLASKAPNSQNFPREDKRPKSLFVPESSENIFVENDLSQAEFRFWCQYSQDPQMLRDLKEGLDIHKMSAGLKNRMQFPLDIKLADFNLLVKDITDEERSNAKRVTFGIMYGMSVGKAAQDIGISYQEAQDTVDGFFRRYSVAKKWLSDTVNLVRTTGQVRGFFGRIRRIPNINSSDTRLREDAEKKAYNSPIQGAASDLNCLIAMMSCKALTLAGIWFKLKILVHDSCLWELHRLDVDKAMTIIKEVAETKIPNIIVPMLVDFKIGEDWGSLKKI